MNITITMTETQYKYVMGALEEHFRLRMGQTFIDLVDDLAFQNIERDKDGKIDDKVFNECIQRRDDGHVKLQEFYEACCGRSLKRWQKTEEVQNEIDLWSFMRHFLWSQRPIDKRGNGVASYPPIQFGTEPPPAIRMEDAE